VEINKHSLQKHYLSDMAFQTMQGSSHGDQHAFAHALMLDDGLCLLGAPIDLQNIGMQAELAITPAQYVHGQINLTVWLCVR